MNNTNLGTDSCYINRKQSDNFSIFNYYTDNSMYVNKNKCNDFTPPFISYIPIGIQSKSVALESDLKGITRNNSRCATQKYIPKDETLTTRVDTKIVSPSKDCARQYKVLPNGYLQII